MNPTRDADVPALLLATGNRHKVGEMDAILRGLLGGVAFRTLCAADFPDVEEPEETGETFVENALIKAHSYARATGLLALADDSGLVVDALDGRPGVRSARYAETPAGRIERVLAELEGVPAERRAARFVCVAALADPRGPAHVREGRVEGRIGFEPRGAGGFGYDPIFVPTAEPEGDPANGEGRTLAEYGEEEKNAVSHRGRALVEIAGELRRALEERRGAS